MLEITNKLNTSIDKKETTCGIFLDFSKAFDTINHEILLMKLHKYGIRGLALDWFKNYLTNRMQFVKINEATPSHKTITCGIPQGSTLGPLLFLSYINDIPNVSKRLNFRIFADDTNIFFSHTNPLIIEQVVNEDLELIMKYCIMNKLSINKKKTNYMIVTSKNKKITMNINHFQQKVVFVTSSS